MCGLVGNFKPSGNGSASDFLEVLILSNHRGPNHQDTWCDEILSLGFNRLAIQDLSEAGHQPMHSPSQRYVMVFNGEVYNHLLIRKKLPRYAYRGHSDTETITHAIDCWGIEKTLGELDGMFAIGIYDRQEKTVTLARDFAGIKPLFFGKRDGDFWFASQFNQVVKGLGRSKLTLSPEGMRDFLQLGYMQAPATIYQEIEQVEPGQYIVFDGHKLTRKYFQRWPSSVAQSALKKESAEHFTHLFQEEVKRQMIADVPVASFLSSGIDSSLVTALAQRIMPDLKACTIGVPGYQFDESAKAKAYARHLGLKHVVRSFTPEEAIGINDDHFRKLGEPFADYSSLPTYIICREGRKDATVMLSGDGGDELFWGYPRWNTFLQHSRLFKIPFQFRKPYLGIRRALGQKISHGPSFFATVGGWVLNNQSHNAPDITAGILPATLNTPGVQDLYNGNDANPATLKNWLRWNEFYAHMQRTLIKVDRMSMAHSLEVRVPFLGKSVIDFAWSQASGYGETHFEKKRLLKQALSQFIPRSLQEQKKIGFSVPIEDWLKGALKEEVLDLTIGSKLKGDEYINEKAWKDRINGFYTNDHNGAWGIWILYAWQKWAQMEAEL